MLIFITAQDIQINSVASFLHIKQTTKLTCFNYKRTAMTVVEYPFSAEVFSDMSVDSFCFVHLHVCFLSLTLISL